MLKVIIIYLFAPKLYQSLLSNRFQDLCAPVYYIIIQLITP
jgi:hypothetical protein